MAAKKILDKLNPFKGKKKKSKTKPKPKTKKKAAKLTAAERAERKGPKRSDQPNYVRSRSTADKKRADRLNMMPERSTRPKRADALNMDPNARSTKINPLTREIKRSVEESDRNFPVKNTNEVKPSNIKTTPRRS